VAGAPLVPLRTSAVLRRGVDPQNTH